MDVNIDSEKTTVSHGPTDPQRDDNTEDSEPTDVENTTEAGDDVSYGWRFWLIIASLCATSLLTAVEGTVTATALPTIARNLGSKELYVWFVNAVFLSSAVVQPLFGQLADVFGRRYPTIFAVAIFALGSGIAGGSTSAGMLISGRTLQGIGLGGVNMLIDIVVCDLVPQNKRGAIMGVIFAVFAIGSSLGPFIGGVFADHSAWRWVFYLGLPISGIALLLLVLFLQVNYEKETTISTKLKRLDYVGNGILILSMVSILIALTYGGSIRPWNSWRTLVPLIIGLLGLVLFHIYEATGLQKEPVMPPRLFQNRTSLFAFILVFLHGVLLYWITYFLPVYFQSVLLSNPTRSGVQFLPTIVVLIPFAIISGGLITKIGCYKPICIVGFAMQALGVGLFTTLDSRSSTPEWVVFQIIAAAGVGLVTTSTLPAVQVGLLESDVASSTATWGFLRSLGNIWGVSIPAAIFNSRFEQLSHRISDTEVRAMLRNGKAYEQASAAFITSFREPTRGEIIRTYEGALQRVWQIAITFGLLGVLAALPMRELQLKKVLRTEFGMQKKEQKRT